MRFIVAASRRDLVARPGLGHPSVQGSCRDGLDLGTDRFHRAERSAGDPPGDRTDDEHQEGNADQQQRRGGGRRFLNIVEAPAHQHRPFAVLRGSVHRDHQEGAFQGDPGGHVIEARLDSVLDLSQCRLTGHIGAGRDDPPFGVEHLHEFIVGLPGVEVGLPWSSAATTVSARERAMSRTFAVSERPNRTTSATEATMSARPTTRLAASVVRTRTEPKRSATLPIVYPPLAASR